MAESSRPSVPDLIRRLESDDAFERREAEEALVRLTQQDHGYRWNDPEDDRAAAIERWKAWWRSRQRGGGRKGERKPMAISLQGALLGLDQLKEALENIPPEQLEAHLSKILEKMQEVEQQRRTCDRCGRPEATVHVTERGPGGELEQVDLCEDCFREHRRPDAGG